MSLITRLCVLLGCMAGIVHALEARVVLPPRIQLVDPTGKGLYVTLCQRIFAEGPYDLTIDYFPVNTALNMVLDGRANMTIDYLETSGFCASDSALADESVVAIQAQKRPALWMGLESLEKQKVGIFFSYPFAQRLAVPIDAKEYRVLSVAMQLLTKERLDYLVEFESDIRQTAQNSFIDMQEFAMHPLFSLKTRWVFPDTPEGQALKAFVETRWSALRRDGTLAKLYGLHEKPLPEGG